MEKIEYDLDAVANGVTTPMELVNSSKTTFQLIDGQKLNAVPITHETDFEQAELIVVE